MALGGVSGGWEGEGEGTNDEEDLGVVVVFGVVPAKNRSRNEFRESRQGREKERYLSNPENQAQSLKLPSTTRLLLSFLLTPDKISVSKLASGCKSVEAVFGLEER